MAQTGGEWSAEKPTTNGVFLVKAVIPETTNYSAAEKTARFLVYKSFEDLYSDWVEITFPNYQGDALYDYPVLIAISEQAYPGFSYARAGNGDSIAFMDFPPDLQQQPLSFEVDTWNPGGTSLIWVKIPRLYSKEGYAKTTIRMYWHLKEGAEAPGPDPADVWLGYSGVWHFGEAANADNAATVRATDSTGNIGGAAIGIVNYVCHELFCDRLTLTNELPTVAGRYKITFSVEEPGFNVITKEIYFSVLDHADYPSTGATEDGRILLGNDDSMGDWGESSITNQAFQLVWTIFKVIKLRKILCKLVFILLFTTSVSVTSTRTLRRRLGLP